MIFVHLAPLFLAPVLVVAVVVDFLEEHHSPDLVNSPLLLAAFGYLFHASLIFFVVRDVFNWNDRVYKVRKILLNLHRRASATFAVYLVRFASVLTLAFSMAFILQESMLSAPLLTGQRTLVSEARRSIQDHLAGANRFGLPLVFILLTTFMIWLLASYWGPTSLGLFMLRRAAHESVIVSSSTSSESRSWTDALILSLPVASSLGISLIITEVLAQMMHKSSGATLVDSQTMLDTLASPSVIAGVISLPLLLCTVLLVARKRLSSSNYHFTDAVALLPPSLVGIAGLSLAWNPLSTYVILLATVGGYAYFTMRFFSRSQALSAQRPLIHNASALCLSPTRKLDILIASKAGGLLPTALLGCYMLWIEDGIQDTLIGGDTNNLANRVRGLHQGSLPPFVYAGSLLTFGLWTVLALALLTFSLGRFRWVSRRLRQRSVAVMIGVVATLVTTFVSADCQTTKHTSSRLSCVMSNEALLTGSREPGVTLPPKCPEVLMHSLKTTGATLHIHVPASTTRVVMDELHFARGGSVAFDSVPSGGHISIMINSLLTDADSLSSELSFQQIHLDRLDLEGQGKQSLPGQTSIGPSVIILPGASVDDLHIHGARINDLNISLPPGEGGTIHTEDVVANSITIRGAVMTSARAAGELAKSVQKTNVQELTMSGLRLRGSIERPGLITLEHLSIRSTNVEVEADQKINIELSDIDAGENPNSRFTLTTLGSNVTEELRAENLRVAGNVRLDVKDPSVLETLILDDFSSVEGQSSANVEIHAPSFRTVTLHDLSVSTLQLCGEVSKEESLRLNAADVNVSNDLYVPRALISTHWNDTYGPFQRARFLKVLQEHGRYCDDKKAVGIDAVYMRKKLEMEEVHPLLTWLVDWATGFGVKLQRAALTFVLLLVSHSFLRMFILLCESPRHVGSKTWIVLMVQACAGTFTMREHGQHSECITSLLEGVRLVISWCCYAQLTLCAIYLGQTTLQ